MIGSIGFVDEQAAGGESPRQGCELLAEQAPEDHDEIEAVRILCGPREGCGGGFAAGGDRKSSLGRALPGNGESFIGDVGQGDAPAALGEPEGVTAGAAGEIESAASRQSGARFDEE